MLNQSVIFSLNHKLLIAAVLAGFILLIGCAGAKHQVMVKEAYRLQEPVVMRTSETDHRPDWTKESFIEKDGDIWFTGSFMNGKDYSLTVRCATIEAVRDMAESVRQTIRAEVSSYIEGDNGDTLNRWVRDGIASMTGSLTVSGIRKSRMYYEEVFSPADMEKRYNVFVLMRMPKADYLKCKADAVKQMRDRFRDAGQEEAKRKADELLNELKHGLT